MTTELLTWHPVAERLPDADITVLCWSEPGGEWFSGWLDGTRWLDAASGGKLDGVTFWAEPVGPGAALAAQPAQEAQPVAWIDDDVQTMEAGPAKDALQAAIIKRASELAEAA